MTARRDAVAIRNARLTSARAQAPNLYADDPVIETGKSVCTHRGHSRVDLLVAVA